MVQRHLKVMSPGACTWVRPVNNPCAGIDDPPTPHILCTETGATARLVSVRPRISHLFSCSFRPGDIAVMRFTPLVLDESHRVFVEYD